MPDRRRHRGPHPEDRKLFAPAVLPVLQRALDEYDWLLDRGYARTAALRLVGDHHQLEHRQRLAILRCGSGVAGATSRRAKVVPLAGRDLLIDGFNVILTVEAALAGGILLRGRDRFVRDLASVHGSYRTVEETARALDLLVSELAARGPASVHWLVDRPVSNSGRVAGLLRDRGQEVDLVDAVDRALGTHAGAVATSDGPVIDRAGGVVDLVGAVLERVENPWLVDLGPDPAIAG